MTPETVQKYFEEVRSSHRDTKHSLIEFIYKHQKGRVFLKNRKLDTHQGRIVLSAIDKEGKTYLATEKGIILTHEELSLDILIEVAEEVALKSIKG